MGEQQRDAGQRQDGRADDHERTSPPPVDERPRPHPAQQGGGRGGGRHQARHRFGGIEFAGQEQRQRRVQHPLGREGAEGGDAQQPERPPSSIPQQPSMPVHGNGAPHDDIRWSVVIPLVPHRSLSDDFVHLRRWALDDLRCIEEACGDQRITESTTVPCTYSEAAARAYVERQWSRQESGEGMSLAIALAAGDRAVGSIVLMGRPQPGRGDRLLGCRHGSRPGLRHPGGAATQRLGDRHGPRPPHRGMGRARQRILPTGVGGRGLRTRRPSALLPRLPHPAGRRTGVFTRQRG